MQLVRTEEEMLTLRGENSRLNEMLKMERNRTQIHERKLETMENQIDELMRKLRDRDTLIKELQTQNNQKQSAIKEMEVLQVRQKRKFETKIASETEKATRQLTKELKERDEAFNVSAIQITLDDWVSNYCLIMNFYLFQDRLRAKNDKIDRILRIATAPSTEQLNVLPPQNKERAAIASSVSMTPRAPKPSSAARVSKI